jgi:hypothetical protein
MDSIKQDAEYFVIFFTHLPLMINPFNAPEAAYTLDSLAPEAGWAS